MEFPRICKKGKVPEEVAFKYADRERKFDLKRGNRGVIIDGFEIGGDLRTLSDAAKRLMEQSEEVVWEIVGGFGRYWGGRSLFAPVDRERYVSQRKKKGQSKQKKESKKVPLLKKVQESQAEEVKETKTPKEERIPHPHAGEISYVYFNMDGPVIKYFPEFIPTEDEPESPLPPLDMPTFYIPIKEGDIIEVPIDEVNKD